MTRSAHTTALRAKLAPLRSRLMDHKVYTQIGSIDQLRGFMEHHVFAVWDFMSLLKALQAKLCCNSVPWLPSPNQQACRLINEIVLAEESDTNSAGTFASHFEQYYSAMKNAGANTSCIDNFISELRNGASINQALSDPMIPAAAKEFVTSSFAVIDSNDTLAIAAAFTYGREELLPQLFQRIVDELSENRTASLDDFRYYLHRHVELDGDEHGPMAEQMILSLCGEDNEKWQRIEDAAACSMKARIALWDGFSSTLDPENSASLSKF
ncbi:MAG: DUF3050 domain-containing protein [Planctomycetaceae bacterium]|nr:DUF3050 domain-containing protein [Planctomycetaceae bacterium]